MESMILRDALIDDWMLLLDWRNEEETRLNSHTVDKIDEEHHMKWLQNVLKDEHQKLYIAVENEIPMGTVKAEFEEDTGVYKLSWTTSPNARGKGVGKRMVKLMADKIDSKLRAEIKEGNIASVKIAEHAGLKFQKADKGILHFSNF